MGLFFHFGLVAVIFAYDGLRKSMPSYKPSLAFAVLCLGHVAFLISIDLLWDLLQTRFWYSLTVGDMVQRMLLILTTICAGYLSACLYRLRQLRLIKL